MAERIINIVINGEQLDVAIEKANQLVELLREADRHIDSLCLPKERS
ncbi:hypothetical protein AAEU42_13230 [Pseudoflavonifractor phocaeensis]